MAFEGTKGDSRRIRLYEAYASLNKKLAGSRSVLDIDEEETSRLLLKVDSKPFKESLVSVLSEDSIPSLDPDWYRDIRAFNFKELVIKWCSDSKNPGSWISPQNLPKMFRFAQRRPLMSEIELQQIFKALGLDPKLHFLSTSRTRNAQPRGRTKRILYGLDPEEGQGHVSHVFEDALPHGLSLLDRDEEMLEDDDLQGQVDPAKKQIVTQLWQLYDQIDAGGISLAEAPDRYRDILNDRTLDLIDLADQLDTYGILTNHIKQGDHDAKVFGNDKTSQLWCLYNDIQEGCVAIEDAPSHYRDVFRDPTLSIMDLAEKLGDHGLPWDQLTGPLKEMDVLRDAASDYDAGPSHSSSPKLVSSSSDKTSNQYIDNDDDDEDLELIQELTSHVEFYREGAISLEQVVSHIYKVTQGIHLDNNNHLFRLLQNPEISPALLVNRLKGEALDDKILTSSDKDGNQSIDGESRLVLEVTDYVELYRKGSLSLEQAVPSIRSACLGITFYTDHLIDLLEDSSTSPALLVSKLLEESVDEDIPSLSEGSDEEDSLYDVDEEPTLRSIKEQFTQIYDDVLQGRVPLNTALNRFRSVLGYPRMTNSELSRHLETYGVPPDLFFGSESLDQEPESPKTGVKKPGLISRMPNKPTEALEELTTDGSHHDTSNIRSASNVVQSVRQELVSDGIGLHTPPSESNEELTKEHHLIPPMTPEDSRRNSSEQKRGLSVAQPVKQQIVENIIGLDTPPAESNVNGLMGSESISQQVTTTRLLNSVTESLAVQDSSLVNQGSPKIAITGAETENSSSSNGTGRKSSSMPPPPLPTTSKRPRNNPRSLQSPSSEREKTTKPDVRPSLLASAIFNNKKLMDMVSDTPASPSQTIGDSPDTSTSEMSTSPEDGITYDLFGLALPTDDARRIGRGLKLPPKNIRKIRSRTPRRYGKLRTKRATANITFPRPKRKASVASHDGTVHKVMKVEYDPNMFARDGETQEMFIRKHFTDDVLRLSKVCCLRCKKFRNCRCRATALPESLLNQALGSLSASPRPHSKEPKPASTLPADRPPPSKLVELKHSKAFSDDAELRTTLNRLSAGRLLEDIERTREDQLEKASDADIAIPSIEMLRIDSEGPAQKTAKTQDSASWPSAVESSDVLSGITKAMSTAQSVNRGSECPIKLEVLEQEDVDLAAVSSSGQELGHIQYDKVSLHEREDSAEPINSKSVEPTHEAILGQHRATQLSSKQVPLGSSSLPEMAKEVARHPPPAPRPRTRELPSPIRQHQAQPSDIYQTQPTFETLSDLNRTLELSPPLTRRLPELNLGSSPSTPDDSRRGATFLGTPSDLDRAAQSRDVEQSPEPSNSSKGPSAVTDLIFSSLSLLVGPHLLGLLKGPYHQWKQDEAKRRRKLLGRYVPPSIKPAMTIIDAIDEAVNQRKSYFLYMAELRRARTQANKRSLVSRFFQSSNGSSGASGSTAALNRLFDKYRGT